MSRHRSKTHPRSPTLRPWRELSGPSKKWNLLAWLASLSPGRDHFCRMHREMDRARVLNDVFRFVDFRGTSMHYEEKLVRFKSRFVLNNAVLWNTDAIEPCPNSAQTSHDDSAFECSDDPGNQGSCHKQRSDTWNRKECGSKQQSPEASPEGTVLAPILHTV